MENMTMSSAAMAMAATVDSSGLTAVHDGSARSISLFIVTVVLVGLALFILFTFCGLPLLGFVSTGIAAGSIAAAWMSSIGVVAAGSLFALLQAIAMGGIPAAVVLLGIVAVVAVAVGAFEAVVWAVHAWSASSVDVLGWWHSILAWLLQVWHSATDWVVHLWESIPAHHKWKILYT